MKNLIVSAVLLTGLLGFSQRGEQEHNHGFSPEQIASLQTKKLTLVLDLNEAQQVDVQKLNEESALLRKEKREAHRTSKKENKLTELSLDEKFTIQSERLDQAIAQKVKMKNILSEEQFAKWEKLQMRKGHFGKKRFRTNSRKGKHLNKDKRN